MSTHPIHLPLPTRFDLTHLRAAARSAGQLLWAVFEEAGRQRARHELRTLEQRWAVTSPEMAQVVRQCRSV